MSARYLFGPVSKNFADQNLKGPVERAECLIFDDDGSFPVRSDDSWETVASRLPAGWQPDFLVLSLQYRVIPQGMWRAPIPIIGLAGDWNLLWHPQRPEMLRTTCSARQSTTARRQLIGAMG
jgi:hypothetical protein